MSNWPSEYVDIANYHQNARAMTNSNHRYVTCNLGLHYDPLIPQYATTHGFCFGSGVKLHKP